MSLGAAMKLGGSFMLPSMQVKCQGLRDTAADAGTRHANSCFARFDDACLKLAEMSRAGKLPGEFFGRLCNTAHVSGADAAAAVNAVAKEAINLVGSARIRMVRHVRHSALYSICVAFWNQNPCM